MTKLEEALNRLRSSKETCIDVETSGLDWKSNHVVGYVLSFGPRPDDSYYLPVRHHGGGNCVETFVPDTATGWDGSIHPVEKEIINLLDRPTVLNFGHNLAFDTKFLYRLGLRFSSQYDDTMINACLLNEQQASFSLAFCAKQIGIQQKYSLEDYIRTMVPEARSVGPRDAMGFFWRLRGDDPRTVEYAAGDGTTTWQLRDWQRQELARQDLLKVHDIESRLIPVLARMSTRGLKIDVNRLDQVREEIKVRLAKAELALPPDFNSKAPTQVRALMEKEGHVDWPTTPKGAPSFPESWLLTNPVGKQIVAVRKYKNIESSFISPLIETHLHNGRVHPEYNQLRGDEYGTVTGRLCLAGDTQVTIPGGFKLIKELKPGDLVYSYTDHLKLTLKKVIWAGRTGHKPLLRVHWRGTGNCNTGYLDVTAEHKLRLVDGTYIAASDLRGGKLERVNSTTRSNYGQLVYRKGERILALHRQTKLILGQFRNYLYPTGCRKKPLKEARAVFEITKGWCPEHVHHKDNNSINDMPDNLEGMTRAAHTAYHALNASPKEKRRRIQALTNMSVDAKKRSRVAQAQIKRERFLSRFTKTQIEKALQKTGGMVKAAKLLKCDYEALQRRVELFDIPKPNPHLSNHNHQVLYVEPLEGIHPVYDIEVEGTHNFIANELCVHNSSSNPNLQQIHKRNEELGRLFRSVFVPDDGMIWCSSDLKACEPRLLAYYSRAKVFLDGFRNDPNFDPHGGVAKAVNAATWDKMTDHERKDARETGKRINQTLITGGGKGVLVSKYGIPPDKIDRIWNDYFDAMPEIRPFQRSAAARMQGRGYVVSLLGRRARREVGREYKAVNRLLQCGNADLVKTSMVLIDEFLRSENDKMTMINSVHDALDFEYLPGDEKIRDRCLEMMTDFPKELISIDVPLGIDWKEGPNWSIATYGEEK